MRKISRWLKFNDVHSGDDVGRFFTYFQLITLWANVRNRMFFLTYLWLITWWCFNLQIIVYNFMEHLRNALSSSKGKIQSCQGVCGLWMLIVLLIGKRLNCPVSKTKNIFCWNGFQLLDRANRKSHCRWIPPTVQEPFTYPLTLIPGKTQLPESHHLKYQRPGSKNTSALSSRCSVVCEIECDACLASVCLWWC